MKCIFAIIATLVLLPSVHPRRTTGSTTSPYAMLRGLLGHSSGASRHALPVADRAALEADLEAALAAHGQDQRAARRPSAQFLLTVFQRLQHGAPLPHADTVRTFTAAVPKTHVHHDISMSFNLSGISPQESTQLAELRLRPVRHLTSERRAPRRLRVAMKFADGREERLGGFRVQARRDAEDGFFVFDLTQAVRRVLADGEAREASVQFTLKARRPRRQARDATADPEITENDAVLVVYSKDPIFFKQFQLPNHSAQTAESRPDNAEESHSRQKRSKGSKKSKGKRGRCAVKKFQVDFETIGWGQWIVYPKRFNAGLCSGRCPIPVNAKYEPTNHAVLQSLMRLSRRDSAPRPCCVPTRLLPMSMLYYEKDEVVIRHHEDMVVDTCGCR